MYLNTWNGDDTVILGNVEGIKKSIISELDDLHKIQIQKDIVFSEELVRTMSAITEKLGREVSVGINRKGKVTDVAVGDSTTVELPLIDISEKKLSGIRIVHTHPTGNSKLSALDISALIKLKLDAMIAIGVRENFEENTYNLGFVDVENNTLVYEEMRNLDLQKAVNYNLSQKLSYISKIIQSVEVHEETGERAILVGIDNEEILEELEELAKACNVETVYKVFQKRSKIDKTYFVGSGKVNEIDMIRQAKRANLVIFDDELAGSQIRNLEEGIGCKVIDRTTLILEIFARRARSREAKLQVELAQLKYRLPKLAGMGTVLSRTGGGIGTRGPGEKKLEIDKRHIRERVYDLNKELSKVKKTRQVQREKRNRGNISKVSLVGYTNAGKSTLRNKLCDIYTTNAVNKEKVFEADMLFATLETTVRAIHLPDNRKIALSDTVGFIRKLPHDLVEAFKSTLEDVLESDLLLHVVDASNPEVIEQIDAVNNVLEELGALDKKIILVLNKIDDIDKETLETLKEKLEEEKIIEISAYEGTNLDKLIEEIGNEIPVKLREREFVIPYSDQKFVSMIHEECKILEEDYRAEGTYIKALANNEIYNRCSKFEIQ